MSSHPHEESDADKPATLISASIPNPVPSFIPELTDAFRAVLPEELHPYVPKLVVAAKRVFGLDQLEMVRTWTEIGRIRGRCHRCGDYVHLSDCYRYTFMLAGRSIARYCHTTCDGVVNFDTMNVNVPK